MVSNETWMGSGTYVTLAPESELFLGYMPYGPTLGRTGTNKAHLIKYSLGYAVDGASVVIENAHGEQKGSETLVKHFTDYYHLVPDLYTGCIAKFYYTENGSDTAPYDLKFTAVVAGNDADAIYFSGNLDDFPSLYGDKNAVIESGVARGYIVLESQGSVIPAPIAFEKRNSANTSSSYIAADNEIGAATGIDGSLANLQVDDIIYNAAGIQVGKIWGFYIDDTALTGRDAHDGTTTDDTIHLLSASLGSLAAISTQSDGIGSITTPTSVAGILTAGDYISFGATRATADILGIVITINSTGLIVKYAQYDSATATADPIYWGRDIAGTVASSDNIYTVKPRVLSDNWAGIANSVTPSNVEIETKQVNMALGGSRNFSFQYRGMETAGAAGMDLNLNHGSWLYYALGSLTSADCTGNVTLSTNPTNVFEAAAYDNTSDYAYDNASIWVGYSGGDTALDADSSGSTQNAKFHRVPNGTSTLCPPILPKASASPLTAAPSVTNGIASNTITYTFAERNDSVLPSLALELSNQKGSALTSEPMVDRNTYNQTVYAQIYPGCVVNSLSLTANENEEVKATLDFNVKRVFECPDGYVARMYDATNNDTNEFKNLFNFGNVTNNSTNIVQEFIDPFFFSDGTISMFGQEFLKVQSMSMSITNNVQDKRYFGQYNKQIKMSVPTQRNYEVTISAQVTDRRIFDELRRQSPHRFALGVDAVGSNSRIQLLFTKNNGESFKLQFDDYLISASTWPIPDDRGPIYVDFTIMPIRVNVMNAVSSWVMQS
jgi:hypothetical protein